MRLIFAFLPVLFFSLSVAQAAIFDWEEKPSGGNVAAFRMFVPDDVKKVQAVILLAPGVDGDGRPMVSDPEWQALAARTQSALVGHFQKGGTYALPETGSGKTLLKGLKAMAKESGHPEIEDAPFAVWGISLGGVYAYNFACWKPERTIAFVANKGTNYITEPSPSVRKVPSLWFIGGDDNAEREKNITARYEDNRKRGALWGLVVEPGVAHTVGRSKELGIVFFEEVMKARLDGSGKLLAVDPKSGWLGDLQTFAVEKNSALDGGDKKKSWLPGEATAKLWSDVVSGGTSGAAPAPAP